MSCTCDGPLDPLCDFCKMQKLREHFPPDPTPTIDEMRAQIDRLEKEHGQPMVRLLVGTSIMQTIREHTAPVGIIPAAAFGVPVFEGFRFAPDEWAPVYCARKR